MTIFGKSARDTFLMAAIAQAGITEETVATAQAANKTDFLGTIAVGRLETDLTSKLAAAEKELATLKWTADESAVLLGNVRSALGVELLTADAINAAVAAKVEAARKEGEEAGSRAAAAELAARGHAPVPTAPAAAADVSVPKAGEGLRGPDRIAAIFKAQASAGRLN